MPKIRKKKWLSPLFGAIIPPNCLYLLYIIYRDSGDIAEKSHKCAKKVQKTLVGIEILPTFAPAIRKKHGAQQKGRMSDVMRNDDSSEVAEVLKKKLLKSLEVSKILPTFAPAILKR